MNNITLPEPFQTALEKSNTAVIDYKSTKDHEWLKEHGFDLRMSSDCSYNVSKNGKILCALSATSYGDWGSYFQCADIDNKALEVFLDMYDEGIITLWRLSVYLNKKAYFYYNETKQWIDVQTGEVCQFPFAKPIEN